MTENMDLRRLLYTDEGLCATTLDMVRIAQGVGAAAKFCGSGGAAVACCPGGEEQVKELQCVCLKYYLFLRFVACAGLQLARTTALQEKFISLSLTCQVNV